jgi:hypothetical protein
MHPDELDMPGFVERDLWPADAFGMLRRPSSDTT